MAETSAIAWTKSTFNPWIGCTKIGPGCDHCYAEALDHRMKFGGAEHWGPGVPRYRTSASNWAQPLKWNRQQGIVLQAWKDALERNGGDESRANAGGMCKPEPWRVFCASLADVFDNEVPDEWRMDLFKLIHFTPNLSWLLVTKRIGNVTRKIPMEWIGGFPPNVRILITVVNQEEADRDIPKLLALPCKNGISYEPALGPVDFTRFPLGPGYWGRAEHGRTHVDWIIVGGESTQGSGKARPFDIEWARSTVKQCKAAGIPCFVKQFGSAVAVRNDSMEEWPDEDAFSDAIPDEYQPAYQGEGVCIRLRDRAGADPDEWPEDLRVREFPV